MCAIVWKNISWILRGFCIPGVRSVFIFSDIWISINMWMFSGVVDSSVESLFFAIDILLPNFNNFGTICNRIFNDTHRERLVFYSIQYRNDWLAASNLSYMFTQSIKFYTFDYQCRCLKNVIHQIDSKNGWLLLSAKFGLVFLLTLEKPFS